MNARAAVDTTIVVPTFNEAGNIRPLVDELTRSFAGRAVEILFVDDSDDNTPEVVRSVSARSSVDVRLIHREPSERMGGLSGAVTEGINAASGRYVVVMDGDLQHPPSMAPVLRDTANAGADMVIASRYCGSGSSDGLAGGYRRLVSSGSTVLARALFPRRVGAVTTDPMTGFFCVRRDAVDTESLRPRGFKILLELLVRNKLRVTEVPFEFDQRHSGESKASWRNGLHFLWQLVCLRLGVMVGFGMVGLLGVVVNLLVMAGLIHSGLLRAYVPASVIATEVSLLHNLLLQERFVFRATRATQRVSTARRATYWFAYGNAEALVRLPLLMLFVDGLRIEPVVGQAVTLVIGFVARYAFTSKFLYGAKPAANPAPTAHAAARPASAPPPPPGEPGSTYEWLEPPTESERDSYLASGQHRWIFAVQALAFAGIAFSLYGLSHNSYWAWAFFLPLAVMTVEQLLALRTSTFRRRWSLSSHRATVSRWAPAHVPSVDVFLPVCGEELALLENTASYVARLRWDGELNVYLLDDAADPRVRRLADRYGFHYFARPGSAFKKAGNLQWAYERSHGDVITILDADFVPREDYLTELVPYLDDHRVGLVQSPQYFSTLRSMSWLERTAGATQEMFYRLIQPSRDVANAAICVGTSALYRRSALDEIGGFPLIGHSEDVYTGVAMGREGYRVIYVPTVVSRGRCPDSIDSFIAQQYRWCEGSMSLMADPTFHTEQSMTLGQRLCFWSGFLYYITTAMTAVLAPLGILVMLWFFPTKMSAVDTLPLLGAPLLWLVVYPALFRCRWRMEVLRVQAVYGFAHLFCIYDLVRESVSEWVATNASSASRPLGFRVRRFMTLYVGGTQLLIVGSLIADTARFGPSRYWAAAAFAALTAYVFVPVAIEAGRGLTARRPAAKPPVIDLAAAERAAAERGVIDLVAAERAAQTPGTRLVSLADHLTDDLVTAGAIPSQRPSGASPSQRPSGDALPAETLR